jgi:magnesium transporter
VTGNLKRAVEALDSRYLREHPWEAARKIEELPPQEVARELESLSAPVLAPVWRRLTAGAGAAVLTELPDELSAALLSELMPVEAVPILSALEEERTARYLGRLPAPIRSELEQLMAYPIDSAGRIMDPRTTVLRQTTTAGQAIAALRGTGARAVRNIFLVDDHNRLAGSVGLQDAATAPAETPLGVLAQPILASVTALAQRDEVAEVVERYRLTDLPVVDAHGHLLGVIPDTRLMRAVQEDLSADMQTMTGASAEERALSSPLFAVRKRLPWLQINLLTAFLAAAVVGLFESTIAQFTALAVLLPVVAGQSGNAGAQPGTSRDLASPMARGDFQGSECRVPERSRRRAHLWTRRLPVEPLDRVGARDRPVDDDRDGRRGARRRAGAHQPSPARTRPGPILLDRADHGHGYRGLFRLSGNRDAPVGLAVTASRRDAPTRRAQPRGAGEQCSVMPSRQGLRSRSR